MPFNTIIACHVHARYGNTMYIPVNRVSMVRVALELLVEDTLVGEGTSDRECVPDCCPLWLPPQSQQLANVVNQSCQLQPV